MLAQSNSSQSSPAKASYSAHCTLQAGDSLQLQFVDYPERGNFMVTVIGYVDGCSLMISAPKMNGHILLLREGQQFSVRLLSGKQIISFQSEVLKVYNNPFSYVHLKPPAEVLQYNVRNAHRVQVDSIASIHQVISEDSSDDPVGQHETRQVETIAGKILDMSTTGCLLQLIRQLPDSKSDISLSTKVVVAEQERLINLDAAICSYREEQVNDRDMYLYGVRLQK